MTYVILFLLALVLNVALVPLVKRLAFKVGAIDVPNNSRKIHKQPIPLLGGLSVAVAFFITLFVYLHFYHPNFAIVPMKFYWAIFTGALILMITGLIDDRYNLRPKYLFIGPVIASLVIVFSGIGVGITQLSNPFGHPFNLGFHLLGIPFSAIFVFVFLMGMIFTTKFLDGMDGLASGVGFIASLTLFFLSLTPHIEQPITASLTIIFCGALFGFLIYNFNPASIFLGESGSVFVGFMLGTFSVLLGGKVATAILVMGIPILDVAWVIVRRLWYGSSPFQSDRKHLHFRLLDIGFSQKETVLILYCIAASFGLVAIFLQSYGKLISLIFLLVVMFGLAIFTVMAYKVQHPHIPEEDELADKK